MGKVENMERVMTEKGCDNCYYTYFDERAYPCSLCIRGIERTDQWQPSRKTKADCKTEPKPICESCSKNPCKKKKMINDIGHWVSECTEFDRKTEPQTDIGTSDTVYSDTAGYVPRVDMTDCSLK